MTTTATGKMMTRAEVWGFLGISEKTLERYIRDGRLKPSKRKGGRFNNADLFTRASVEKLKRELDSSEDSDVSLGAWQARIEAAAARLHLLRCKWVYLPDFIEAWARCILDAAARVSESWPEVIAAAVRDIAPQDASWIGAGDEAFVPSPHYRTPGTEYLTAEEVLNILGQDSHPWNQWARPAITKYAERGFGISIDQQGRWRQWRVADGIPPEAPTPRPLMRPLLEQAAAVFQRAPIWARLAHPAPEPVERSSSIAEARAAFQRIQADITRFKTAVAQGGHVTRDAAEESVAAALVEWRARWWNVRALLRNSAGNYEESLAVAQRTRSEALHALRLTKDQPSTEIQ